MSTILLIATLISGTKCAVFLDTTNIEYIDLQYTEILDVNIYDASIGLDSSFKYLGDIDLRVNEYQTQQVGLLCQ
jgi:hypothetical protein